MYLSIPSVMHLTIQMVVGNPSVIGLTPPMNLLFEIPRWIPWFLGANLAKEDEVGALLTKSTR